MSYGKLFRIKSESGYLKEWDTLEFTSNIEEASKYYEETAKDLALSLTNKGIKSNIEEVKLSF